jgi:hypothetical protein
VSAHKISFGEMREMSIRSLLVHCSDYHRSHSVAISSDRWPDDVRLSDLEPLLCVRHAASSEQTAPHREENTPSG